MDGVALVERVAQGDVSRAALSFVPLMRGADAPGLVTRWREVAGALPDERDQATIGFLALTFAKLVTWGDVWRHGLEGWNVEKSPYWQEVRAEGRTEGRVEGRAEGRLEQAQQALIEMIQVRFDPAVVAELTPRVRLTTDVSVLNRCLKLIVPGDLDQLRALLTVPQLPA